MDRRLGIFELAATHGLRATQLRRLQELAGLHHEPAELRRWRGLGLAVLGAALGGFGIILWIAANWDTLGRTLRFALLQAFVLAMCLGAFARPAARTPLALLALLGIGALLAYFGQTYQTGADPWQLFALWVLLALPLCLAARSDVLWAPWILLTMVAISLWTYVQIGHRWRVLPEDLAVHALAWGAAIAVAAAMSPQARGITGAGPWALRTAVTLAVILVSANAMKGLFALNVAPQYLLGLMVLAGAILPFLSRIAFDVYCLSALALGINLLLVFGLAHELFRHGGGGGEIGRLFILGLAAAALLAASVKAILHLAARHALTRRES